MGELLQFPIDRATPATFSAPPGFFFDVADPFSYLAAERVERTLGEVEWVAVDGSALDFHLSRSRLRGRRLQELRTAAEARAAALRLPLVWPERFPAPTPCAMRAAAFACELGCGSAFALALSRLAFCGGFELDDPEALAEAAAAASIPLGACLDAAGEAWRDEELREVAASLRGAGVHTLPAFRVAGRWLQGEDGLLAAATLHSGAASRPLAPAG